VSILVDDINVTLSHCCAVELPVRVRGFGYTNKTDVHRVAVRDLSG